VNLAITYGFAFRSEDEFCRSGSLQNCSHEVSVRCGERGPRRERLRLWALARIANRKTHLEREAKPRPSNLVPSFKARDSPRYEDDLVLSRGRRYLPGWEIRDPKAARSSERRSRPERVPSALWTDIAQETVAISDGCLAEE
jgi:hypothetical protein